MTNKYAMPDSEILAYSPAFDHILALASWWWKAPLTIDYKIPCRSELPPYRNSQLDVIMLSFYHSQPIYSISYPGSPRYSAYTPYTSPLTNADPEVRYRRAVAEYLSAEGEYKALLHAREQAKLRARVARVEEALRRQKRARLLRAEISRARREQQAWELERTFAKALSREEISKDYRSFRDIASVICGSSGRPRPARQSPEPGALREWRPPATSGPSPAPRRSPR